MVRLLNVVQGVVTLFTIVLAVFFKYPIWVPVMGVFFEIVMSLVIVFKRLESPKGRAREAIECIVAFLFGIGGVVYIAFTGGLNSQTITPWWFIIAGLPAFLFNLGFYLAWTMKGIETIFKVLGMFFEYCSGEKIETSNG
jgi:hypothetical protein